MCLQSMSLFFVSTSIVVECAFSQCYVFVSTTLLAVGLKTHSTHQSTNSYLSKNTNHHNEITPVAQSPCYNRENEPSSRRGKCRGHSKWSCQRVRASRRDMETDILVLLSISLH